MQGRFPVAAQLRPGACFPIGLAHDCGPQHSYPECKYVRREPRAEAVPIEAVPEAQLAIDPVEPVQRLKLPEALLSPRQREILAMLYDRDMDVAEIARALGIDPQTVRSGHHKAMVKLRAHFRSNE